MDPKPGHLSVGGGAWATGRGLDLGRAGPRSPPSAPDTLTPVCLLCGPAHPWLSAATWWQGAGVHPLGLACERCGCRAFRHPEADSQDRRWGEGGGEGEAARSTKARLAQLPCPEGSLPRASLPAVWSHLRCTWRADAGFAPPPAPRVLQLGKRAREATVALPTGCCYGPSLSWRLGTAAGEGLVCGRSVYSSGGYG